MSYAREDTAAALRIAEALRSHGVEVWFDQNELRGGDAWDQKIRRQIAECALFVPLISLHTQERNKGYFRLEWKLAVEQTHLLLEGVPFLAPVVIDDTRDSGAAVPAEFLRVQWTRLPGALPTPQFVEQIKRLLNAPVPSDLTAPPMPMRPATAAARSADSPAASAAAAPRPSGVPTWLAAVVGTGLLGAVAYFALRPTAKETPVAPAKVAVETKASVAPSAAPAPVVNDKSIAVLPFENRSEDKDNNAFFSDGIHEDILTNLAHIRELRVVSRTSVMEYRGKTENIRSIAQKLGVAYILEGSVQRAGNKVHVTGQLIRAATDEHVWAQNYTRDLNDIFAIQAEIAQAIATELKAALSPQEKTLLEHRPTENLAAYDLYLKARDLRNRSRESYEFLQQYESLLQAAVTLDRKFAAAWAELAFTHSAAYFDYFDHSTARLANAKAASDTSVRLAPEEPEVIRGLGNYYYHGLRDYARATGQFEKLVRLEPNDSEAYASIGYVQRREGKWLLARENLRKAVQLDPGNLRIARDYAILLAAGRRYDDAIAVGRRTLELHPDNLNLASLLASFPLQARGATGEMEKLLASLSSEQANSPDGWALRKNIALQRRDFAEYIRLDQLRPLALEAAVVDAAQGDLAGARTRLGNSLATLRSRLADEPDNATVWSGLGVREAILGHKEEALRCARKGVELLPETLDASTGPVRSADLAFVLAWTGDKDAAISECARLLGVFNGPNVHVMKYDPRYAPLRGDPRFEALLNDPKNNAPLF